MTKTRKEVIKEIRSILKGSFPGQKFSVQQTVVTDDPTEGAVLVSWFGSLDWDDVMAALEGIRNEWAPMNDIHRYIRCASRG
jgi:hypothetical protein